MNFLGKTNFFGGTLSSQDPEIFDSLERELGRQRNEIELIELGMHEKSKEFNAAGNSIYSKA